MDITNTLSRSSRPRLLRPVAGKLVCRSSLARESSSSAPLFLEVDVDLDAAFFVEISKSLLRVRASSLFSSVGLRIRSLLTQSSHLPKANKSVIVYSKRVMRFLCVGLGNVVFAR